jgi:hypothetical protein
MFEMFSGWTRGDYLSLIGIFVSAIMTVTLYFLQKRISDKQKIDHRLEIESSVGEKLHEMQQGKASRKVELYNVKLLGKKYFSGNKRSKIWGYPFHGAELHSVNFDGLEFVINIEEWHGKRYHKVGLVPFDRILGIKPHGDGSFNGMILFVKPKLLQRDKYSIAYTAFRYYRVNDVLQTVSIKPFVIKIRDIFKSIFYHLRYSFYYRWKRR